MVAPTEVFSTITTAQTDADSPVDVTLMGSYRGNLINLNEQIIGPSTAPTYVAAQAHDHDGVNSAPVTIHTLTSGTNVFFRSTVESLTNSTISTVVMQVGIPWDGTIKVRFDMKCSTNGGAKAFAQVLRNGSAVGTTVSQTSTLYISYTDNMAGWVRNDLLQVTANSSGTAGGTMGIKNLILSGGTDIPQIALGVPVQGAT